MTHSELVEIGYKWCLKRCAFAFKELRTQEYEEPDVIGFTGSGTFLLEAKASRTDFLSDKKSFLDGIHSKEWVIGDFLFVLKD